MEFVTLKPEQGGIIRITMNRPQVHNAFNDQMIQELLNAFELVEEDSECRVVVLEANGKSFSAGADLNWMKSMAKMDFNENKADAEQLAKLMNGVYHLSKPVIAKVHGASYGGALGLIAACDLAVADEGAQFCLSEVKIGLVPAVISPYVVEAIGARNAKRYMQTAEVFSAQKAHDMGLLHEVVISENLDNAVSQWAKQISGNSPKAVSAAKELINTIANKPIDADAIDFTSELIAQIRVSEEGQEGLSAFLEKRKPSWKEEQ